MVDYIRAEFYKAFHRKYTWIFLVLMLAGAALMVGGWVYTNANGNQVDFYSGAGILVMMLSMGLYCTILTGDLVFSDQYKIGTMKNEVSFGVPRSRIYLGKLIVECVTALVLCAVILAFYIALCWIALPHDAGRDAQVLQTVGYTLLCALPLWLGGQALSNLMLFAFRSAVVATLVAVGVLGALPQVIKLLGMLVNEGFYKLYEVLLTSPLEVVSGAVGDWAFFGRCCILGACWFAAATAVGLAIFRRREVN